MSLKNDETILFKTRYNRCLQKGVTSQRKCTANYMKTEEQSKPMPISLLSDFRKTGNLSMRKLMEKKAISLLT